MGMHLQWHVNVNRAICYLHVDEDNDWGRSSMIGMGEWTRYPDGSVKASVMGGPPHTFEQIEDAVIHVEQEISHLLIKQANSCIGTAQVLDIGHPDRK